MVTGTSGDRGRRRLQRRRRPRRRHYVESLARRRCRVPRRQRRRPRRSPRARWSAQPHHHSRWLLARRRRLRRRPRPAGRGPVVPAASNDGAWNFTLAPGVQRRHPRCAVASPISTATPIRTSSMRRGSCSTCTVRSKRRGSRIGHPFRFELNSAPGYGVGTARRRDPARHGDAAATGRPGNARRPARQPRERARDRPSALPAGRAQPPRLVIPATPPGRQITRRSGSRARRPAAVSCTDRTWCGTIHR